MNDLYEDLHRGCEIASREYGDLLDKIEQNGGKMSMSDLDELDKLTHTIKSNKTTIAMLDAGGGSYADGYDGSYGDGRRSYNRGSYARRRDSMGRYTSRRAYDDGDMRDMRDMR